jgi:isoleucyl-tRNA synthetase
MSDNKKSYFDPVDPKVDFPKMEDDLVKYWKENKIFEKSVEKNPSSKSWTFLDGPPFITGLPHYGTLLSSIPKDLFPRFWTMKGHRVRRVWGWDCHGLPAENKVENKLGIKRKKDIENVVGIKKFIDECKSYVKDVSSEWEWYVDHVGRWVDFKNAYKTMDNEYMESVMWVFSQMYKKGYIYKGLRVSLYCTHCSTPISNFEVAMDPDNYKELTDNSTYYKFKVKGEKNTYFLAWSTTPWNKIVTTALAVNPKLTYIKVKENDEYYILAKSAVSKLKTKARTIEIMKGLTLQGMEYEPLYDFIEVEKGKNAFQIHLADFVTADEGTGIVTIAPYGEDDLKLMQEKNIHIELHVDDEGHFKKNVPNWAGMFYLKADSLIDDDLMKKGNIYKHEKIKHTVPTCWRCYERLIYAPQNAWYVDVQNLKNKLKKNNEPVNWFPKHFKYGRFLKSMEAAPDWCISRSRYWGSPVPVWECDNGHRFVPESILELEEKSGKKINDLHKPEIDEILITCSECGEVSKRVPEVLDSWIEAGSASLAERHYPFNKEHKLTDFFPPDFIVEYTGQIRAWFYVLHVISTALFDINAYKNVLVTGVVLGTDGRKMSKNFGNYPDPKEMLQKYGGDALRLYLMSIPVMKGEDVAISEEQYRNEIRNYLLTLWNVYNYFVTYANLDGWKPKQSTVNSQQSTVILDKWITARLDETIEIATNFLEKYDTISYVGILKNFVTDLSTWYVRRSREREDKPEFFSTMYYVLCTFSKLSAPITPFITETIYTNLTKEESVHLADWPVAKELSVEDKKILSEMESVRQIVEIGHSLRKEAGVAVRQPLNELRVTSDELSKDLQELIKDELNIKNIKFSQNENRLDLNITKELEEEAKTRELIRKIQATRKEMRVSLDQKIKVTNNWIPENNDLLNLLKTKTLTTEINMGEFSVNEV